MLPFTLAMEYSPTQSVRVWRYSGASFYGTPIVASLGWGRPASRTALEGRSLRRAHPWRRAVPRPTLAWPASGVLGLGPNSRPCLLRLGRLPRRVACSSPAAERARVVCAPLRHSPLAIARCWCEASAPLVVARSPERRTGFALAGSCPPPPPLLGAESFAHSGL